MALGKKADQPAANSRLVLVPLPGPPRSFDLTFGVIWIWFLIFIFVSFADPLSKVSADSCFVCYCSARTENSENSDHNGQYKVEACGTSITDGHSDEC